MIHIRKSGAEDADEIWESCTHHCLGDSFAYSPSSTKAEMLGYWFDKKKHGTPLFTQ